MASVSAGRPATLSIVPSPAGSRRKTARGPSSAGAVKIASRPSTVGAVPRTRPGSTASTTRAPPTVAVATVAASAVWAKTVNATRTMM